MATKHHPHADVIREPFVGPRPFEEKDEDIFFGRQQETTELVSLIVAHPIVLLYAQSGAGKTSLLKASLLPLLKKRNIEVYPPARVRGQGSQSTELPVGTNIYLYNALEYFSLSGLSSDRRARMSLADFLPPRKRTTEREALPLRVVIFDQFEEIFTSYPERFEDRQNFFEQINKALRADPLLRVVFAMREDFIAELDPYASILPEQLQTRYRLMRLNEHAARAAIEKPFEIVNQSRTVKYTFDPEAADKAVDNLRTIYVKTPLGEKAFLGPFVEPVHLQVVCQTLWRKLQSSSAKNETGAQELLITENDVKEFGDVNTALSEFYEETLRYALQANDAAVKTDPKKSETSRKLTEGVLRSWFGRTLITPVGTRGTVFGGRAGETVAGIPWAAVTELEKHRLIRAELRGTEVWYELSHDRFIEPIKESNERWLRRQPVAQQKGEELEAKALEWVRMNKSRSLLLSQADTRDAKAWMDSPAGSAIGYSETLFSFVQASQVARQQRRVRLLVAGWAGTAVVLTLMIAATLVALNQRAIALTARAEAEAARAEAVIAKQHAIAQEAQALKLAEDERSARANAEVARRKADEQTKLAVAARAEAERERQIAIAQRDVIAKAEEEARQRGKELAAALDRAKEQQNIAQSREVAASAFLKLQSDPELSVLLATEAERIKSTDEAEAALRASVTSLSDTRAVLRGHKETVTDAAFISDDTVLTLTSDLSRVWSVSKNESLFRFPGVTASFSTQKPLVMVVDESDNRIARVWDTSSGKEIATLSGDTKIAFATLSPDGKFGVIAREDLTVQLWNISSAAKIFEVKDSPNVATRNKSVMFSPDSKLFALVSAGSETSWIAVWDAVTLQSRFRYGDATSPAAFDVVAFSPNGKFVATSNENFVRISELDSKVTPGEKIIRGHTGVITSMAFSNNSELLITTSTDNTARVWDTKTWQPKSILLGHTNGVLKAAFSGDDRLVVTGSLDNTARIWDVSTGQSLSVLRGHAGPVNSARFSLDDKYVITGSADKSSRVWDAHSGIRITELKGHSAAVVYASYSPDGRLVVTASYDGTARVWEARTARTLHTLRVSEHFVSGAKFSPDGRYIVTLDTDAVVRIWDAETGHELRTLTSNKGTLKSNEGGALWLAVSPDGKRIATSGVRGKIELWDFDAGGKLRTIDAPRCYGNITFSSDSKTLAAGCNEGNVMFWDSDAGTSLGELKVQTSGGSGLVIDVAYSQDGKYLITGNIEDNTVRVWDARTKKPVTTLEGHRVSLDSLIFSNDGKYVASSSSDGSIIVWRVDTWGVVATLSTETGEISQVEFSPDDRFIVTSNMDGTARIYPQMVFVPVSQLLDIASKRVTRQLTPEERAQYLHAAPRQ